jgi:two-component system phosphate regulon sensor histidine kinase PhoR
LADDIRPIIADTEYLADAISRLVDNAIKFSPSGAGSVVLGVDRAEDMVRVSINDQGIGIRPDALDEMFQVLHQVDRDRMEQQGSGSGLAIVKAIVTLHGGEIKVESEPGKGSTFTILLPAAKRRLGSSRGHLFMERPCIFKRDWRLTQDGIVD